MSDELEEIVDNIKQRSFWIRILLMIPFAIAAYFIIVPLILVLSIAQALFTLITGRGNANLRYFSATLALYVTQLVEFLTYLSEVRPFPFSDLPEVDDDSLQEESAPTSAKKQESEKANGAAIVEAKAPDTSTVEEKPAVVKKKAVKAKAVKKKAVSKKAVKKKAAKKAPKTAEKPEVDALSKDASDS